MSCAIENRLMFSDSVAKRNRDNQWNMGSQESNGCMSGMWGGMQFVNKL